LLTKLQFSKRGQRLGTIYLDLFGRAHKFGGAAHFVIRCGRALHGFEDSRSFHGDDVEGGYQLPVVALTMSFPPPWGGAGPVPLSPGHVETLFHEFGHALHSLLSRTEFQHLSGECVGAALRSRLRCRA
jgi:intermediate peptidase